MASLKGFGLSAKGMMTEKEEIEKYKLPICDVQKERRNFAGYMEYEGMDPWEGDSEGTTETDSKTDPGSKGGFKGRINKIEPAKGYTRGYSSKTTKAQKGRGNK